MLSKLKILLLGALAVTLTGALPVSTASAAGNMQCPPGQYWDSTQMTCVIKVTAPGTGPTQPGTGDPGSSESDKCYTSAGREIPCTKSGGWWGGNCYLKAVEPQPPKSDLVWKGNKTGGIYECVAYDGLAGYLGRPHWRPEDPDTPKGPSPRELAEQAVSKMTFVAPQIGMQPKPGTEGVIGLGTWLWVANPSESSIGPMTRSASAGSLTVTATATLDRIEWTMGDGNIVTCRNAGSIYDISEGTNPSPTCGHIYRKMGRYNITAKTFWNITWSGAGQSGVFNRSMQGATNVTMGEVQVIVTHN